jgi:hypothetical protein
MMSSLLLFLLAAAVAPATDPTTAVEETATVHVLVTDRHGQPLPSARVLVNGESPRQGDTNIAGRIVFTNMKSGSYTLRVERDRYITFEKDFAVYGQKGSVVAAISPLSSLTVRKARATARPAPVSRTFTR